MVRQGGVPSVVSLLHGFGVCSSVNASTWLGIASRRIAALLDRPKSWRERVHRPSSLRFFRFLELHHLD